MLTPDQEKRLNELMQTPLLKLDEESQNELRELLEMKDGEDKPVKQGDSDEETPDTDKVEDEGGTHGDEASFEQQQKNLKLDPGNPGRKPRPSDNQDGEKKPVDQGSTDEGEKGNKTQQGRKPRHADNQDGEKKPVLQGSSKLTAEDVKLPDEATAFFESEEFPKEIQDKAIKMFKASVVETVNEHLEDLVAKADEDIQNQINEKHEALAEEVDLYLEDIRDKWIKENQVEVDRSVRMQLVESFMEGLTDLYNEHQIEIPESKVDVVEKLQSDLETAQKQLHESMQTNSGLKKDLNSYKRSEIISKVAGPLGLSETQTERLHKFSEGVDYENDEQFQESINEISEILFKNSNKKKDDENDVTKIDEGLENPDAPVDKNTVIQEETEESSYDHSQSLDVLKRWSHR